MTFKKLLINSVAHPIIDDRKGGMGREPRLDGARETVSEQRLKEDVAEGWRCKQAAMEGREKTSTGRERRSV